MLVVVLVTLTVVWGGGEEGEEGGGGGKATGEAVGKHAITILQQHIPAPPRKKAMPSLLGVGSRDRATVTASTAFCR